MLEEYMFSVMCCLQKLPIFPLQKGLEFPGGGGSLRPKKFKKGGRS